ncbi:hypothetical protein CSPX01_00230 [Colletotrichum filicis]|nr:hypothetical protein CSPX01_00230 [Colletotrichum filicis]
MFPFAVKLFGVATDGVVIDTDATPSKAPQIASACHFFFRSLPSGPFHKLEMAEGEKPNRTPKKKEAITSVSVPARPGVASICNKCTEHNHAPEQPPRHRRLTQNRNARPQTARRHDANAK